MMNSRRNLCILLLLICASITKAQPYIDILHFQYYSFANAKYKDKPNASANTWQASGNFLLPIHLHDNDFLILGGAHDHMGFGYKGDTSYHTSLKYNDLKLAYYKNWKDTKWRGLFAIIPVIATDFKEVQLSDCQIGAATLFTHRLKNNFRYSIGLYYHYEYYGHLILPLLGVDWRPHSRLYVTAVLPSYLTLEYRLYTYIYGSISWNNYHNTFRLNHGPDYLFVQEGSRKTGNNIVQVNLHAYFFGNLVLFGGLGMAFDRYYQLYNASFKELYTNRVFNKFSDQAFFTLGMALRVRLDKDYVR